MTMPAGSCSCHRATAQMRPARFATFQIDRGFCQRRAEAFGGAHNGNGEQPFACSCIEDADLVVERALGQIERMIKRVVP